MPIGPHQEITGEEKSPTGEAEKARWGIVDDRGLPQRDERPGTSPHQQPRPKRDRRHKHEGEDPNGVQPKGQRRDWGIRGETHT